MYFCRRSSADGTVSRYRPDIKIGALKLRKICEACNNGWMSRLEGRVKPLITGLIKKERSIRSLDDDERQTIARWAGKTAIIESRTVPAEHPVDRRILHWMREHENGSPGRFAVAACSYALGALCHFQVGFNVPLIAGGQISGSVVVLGISNLILTCAFPIPELSYDCKCDLEVFQPLWPHPRSWKAMGRTFQPLPGTMQPEDALFEFAERVELFQSAE